MAILVDSTVIIEHLIGRTQRLDRAHDAGAVMTTPVNHYEVLCGARTPKKLRRALRRSRSSTATSSSRTTSTISAAFQD